MVRRRRGRLAPAAAIAALAVGAAIAAGCGSGGGEPALDVYLSAPLDGPAARDGRDVADGARLALADAGGEAGGVAVNLDVLDDAGAAGADPARAGANARTATGDSAAIAYIGELDSMTTRTSLPITNEADLLQVSPGASAVDLTRAAPGSDQVPEAAQPTGTRTFGRVVPGDTAQGAAAAAAMQAAGIDRVGVIASPDHAYAGALLDGFGSVTGAPEQVSGAPLDALYAPTASPGVERAASRAGIPAARVFGADAVIAGASPRAGLPAGAVAISGPLAPSQLPGSDFVARFRARSGRAPGRFAAYGYEAMAVILDSIDRADDPLDRQSVIDAFLATSDRDSILGTYSIDEVGDTTLDRVGAYASTGDRLRALPESLAVP